MSRTECQKQSRVRNVPKLRGRRRSGLEWAGRSSHCGMSEPRRGEETKQALGRRGVLSVRAREHEEVMDTGC